ncbi:MAG: hypothetical protein AB1772_13070 [Candidatus Zixiibacteriota bacterium]
MKHLSVVITLLLLAGIGLVSCDKSVEPIMEPSPADGITPDMASLRAAPWPRASAAAPGPLVTVSVGENELEFWPYTASDFSGTPKDPINLIFFGQASPLDIRAALLALNGDRSALGLPPVPPFNAVWEDDIEGDIQASYGSPCGWTPGAIQLVCGDYYSIRFHLRLFKVGDWTLGGVHFEVLIPGTTTHQVLSWELAEQFVIGDIIRSGLLNGVVPMIPAGQINEAPFGAIPAIIYNGLPVELRGLIGGPLGDVAGDVPIANDGNAFVLNLASHAEAPAHVKDHQFVVQFDQVVPKPFCSSGPYDYVYVYGPITLRETIAFTAWGTYEATFYAEGELSVTPVNPMTGEPIGEPYTAQVRETHHAVYSNGVESGISLRYQGLFPSTAPGAGWFFERFRISSRGGNGYQIIVRCQPTESVSDEVVAAASEIDLESGVAAKALIDIK